MGSYLTHRPAAGRVTEAFGPRPKPTPTSPPIHYGIDYGWGGGDAIYAARSGTVKSYGRLPGYEAYGNRLVIDHGAGRETWYCHLSGARVRPGDYVEGGQYVADMGSTGNVTGKHLHFELRVNGSAVDPAPYFTDTASTGTDPIGDDMTPEQDRKLTAVFDLLTDGVEGSKPRGDIVDRLIRIEDQAGRNGQALGTVERYARWAADQTAPGIPGVRTDGPLAALVREAVNAAKASAPGGDPEELAGHLLEAIVKRLTAAPRE